MTGSKNTVSQIMDAGLSEIFIVRSDSSYQEPIEKFLRDGGYSQIVSVTGMEAALEQLGIDGVASSSARNLDLIFVLLDWNSGGFDFCRQIKNAPAYCDVPLIILVTDPSPQSMKMAFALGAVDYITCPVRDYELLVRTRSALRLKHEIDRRKAHEKGLLESTRQLSDLTSLLQSLSLMDSLTAVGNRRLFDQCLSQEWRRAHRNQSELSLIMLDIDHFKRLNDSFGHLVGDECLKQLVQCVRGSLRRASDMVCRYGGEEFGIILPDTSLEGAIVVAENLRKNVEALTLVDLPVKTIPKLTISVGVATILPDNLLTSKDLLISADSSLYDAKNAGRNCVRQAPSQRPPPAKKTA